jgi:hypothetical protein
MLNIVKIDNYYEVRVKSNDKLIGKFVCEVDGFFYFLHERDNEGLWADYVLIEIGNRLKEINQRWTDHLEKMFK